MLVIASASITEQLGRLFSMELELTSTDPALDFSTIVGGNATIRVQIDASTTRYFNGYVSRFVQTDADSKTGGKYRATLVPWLWFLTRTADCRIFQAMTVPDIIKQVFRDGGFTDFKDSLTATYTAWENCVQYRETDFNFVSRLMEHEGIYYFFTHDNGKHTLVLADDVSAHTTYPNYDSIAYRSQRGGTAMPETISSWMLEQEVQPGTYSLNDFNFTTPSTSLLAQSVIATPSAQSTFEIYDYPGEYGTQSDGTDYAKVRIEELHTQYEVVHGQTDAKGVAYGYTFTLTNAPRSDQNRSYLVTSASYQLSGYDYTTSGGGDGNGAVFACSFTAIDSTKPFRAARITPKPLIQGPQTAIVVGTSGEEIYTDQYGRVKVQFPWDRYGIADENASCWIRVSQSAWAGKAWGSFHIPRVGQEVIVEFLEGDPDLPLVTGNVYNAVTTFPVALPDNKTVTGWRSNSSKGGSGFNELTFDDKAGSELVMFHAQKDYNLYVENDRKEDVANNRHLHVTNNKYENIDANRHETIGVSHFENIKTDHNLTIGGKQAVDITGSQSVKVGGALIHEITGDASQKFSGKLYISATGDLVIESAASITIKVGGSSIAIDSSGIAIAAPQIKIAGDTSVEVSSAQVKVAGDAQVQVSGAQVQVSGDAMTTIKGGVGDDQLIQRGESTYAIPQKRHCRHACFSHRTHRRHGCDEGCHWVKHHHLQFRLEVGQRRLVNHGRSLGFLILLRFFVFVFLLVLLQLLVIVNDCCCLSRPRAQTRRQPGQNLLDRAATDLRVERFAGGRYAVPGDVARWHDGRQRQHRRPGWGEGAQHRSGLVPDQFSHARPGRLGGCLGDPARILPIIRT